MRRSSTHGLAGAIALAALAALVIAASAGGATLTLGFDDLPPNTRVSNEYQASHGVTFASDPGHPAPREDVSRQGALGRPGRRLHL